METLQKQQQQEEDAAGAASRCPPWLQAAIKDIEQRVRALAVSSGAPDDASAAAAEHSFAERAENYYHRRPQLLALLTDLHRRYLYLADRYSQSLLAANKSHAAASFSASDCDCSSDVDDRFFSDSDAGSSLSFQPPPHHSDADESGDVVVAELVMAWVSGDILADAALRREAESARRIELQGSLVEVLESERLVLLGENARLGSRAAAAEAEAAAGLAFARREMARLLAAVNHNRRQRACCGGVEGLRAQVRALEQRNRECFEAMACWEAERKAAVGEIERLRMENRRLVAAEAEMKAAAGRSRKRGGKGGWWWLERVRMAAEWTPCAPASVTVRRVGEQIKGGGGKDASAGGVKYSGGCFCL